MCVRDEGRPVRAVVCVRDEGRVIERAVGGIRAKRKFLTCLM